MNVSLTQYIFLAVHIPLEMFLGPVYILLSTPVRAITMPNAPDLVDPWAAVKYILVNPYTASKLLRTKRTKTVTNPTTNKLWWPKTSISAVGPFAARSPYSRYHRKLCLARSIEAATFGHVKVNHILVRDPELMYVVAPVKVPRPTPLARVHPEWRERFVSARRTLVDYLRRVKGVDSVEEALRLTAQRIGAAESTLQGFLYGKTELTAEQSALLHRLTGIPHYVPVNIMLSTSWRVRQGDILARIDDADDEWFRHNYPNDD